MTKEDIIKPENLVYQKPRLLNDNPMHYCPGCSHGVVHKLIAEVIDEMGMAEKAVGVSPVGCAVFMYNYLDIDCQEAAHGRAPALATAIKRLWPDRLVFTYQGDGDLACIGTAETIHALNRGENITIIFINNAIYGMTGGQMAPTTLVGMKTSTCPYGRVPEIHGYPLKMTEIAATLEVLKPLPDLAAALLQKALLLVHGHEDHKHVPVDAPHHVVPENHGIQHARDGSQHMIPHNVAVAAVDLSQMVHIQNQHHAAAPLLDQPVHQPLCGHAVVLTGQPVPLLQLVQPSLLFSQLLDLGSHMRLPLSPLFAIVKNFHCLSAKTASPFLVMPSLSELHDVLDLLGGFHALGVENRALPVIVLLIFHAYLGAYFYPLLGPVLLRPGPLAHKSQKRHVRLTAGHGHAARHKLSLGELGGF